MRKAKWLVVPLLCCVQLAWGQSYKVPMNEDEIADSFERQFIRAMMAPALKHDMAGMSQSGCNYSLNPLQQTLFMPSDVAAQGGMTATISETANIQGSVPSHNMTVTPGTDVWWDRRCNNCTGATAVYYYKLDNGVQQGPYSLPLQGSAYALTTTTGDVGHIKTYTYVVSLNGNKTQDMIALNIVAGSVPSVIDQDELPTNLINQAVFSFGGGPMSQCQQCINQPSSCLNAEHTPYFTGGYKNPQSGETLSANHVVAGSNVDEYGISYGTWGFNLSVLPGDSPEPDPGNPPTGEIFCTAILNNIFQEGWNDKYTYHIMKTKIKIAQQGSTTDGVTTWYVDQWCTPETTPAIWGPLAIYTGPSYTPLIKVGQYEISYNRCYAQAGDVDWTCPDAASTPPFPLTIGVGGTKYKCSSLSNTPLPK